MKKNNNNFGLTISEISIWPNLWSVLSVALIFATIFCLNSKFLLMPGIAIDVPESSEQTFSNTQITLQIQSEDFMILDDKIISMKTLEMALDEINTADNKDASLLIIADKTTSTQILTKICNIAKTNGFQKLHLATKFSE